MSTTKQSNSSLDIPPSNNIQPGHLLILSPELGNIIYELAIDASIPQRCSAEDGVDHHQYLTALPLVQTCKQMRIEARKLLVSRLAVRRQFLDKRYRRCHAKMIEGGHAFYNQWAYARMHQAAALEAWYLLQDCKEGDQGGEDTWEGSERGDGVVYLENQRAVK